MTRVAPPHTPTRIRGTNARSQGERTPIAYQRVASQGHRWWEVDVTYWAIWLMEKTGLAWNVVRLKDVRPQRIR